VCPDQVGAGEGMNDGSCQPNRSHWEGVAGRNSRARTRTGNFESSIRADACMPTPQQSRTPVHSHPPPERTRRMPRGTQPNSGRRHCTTCQASSERTAAPMEEALEMCD
jgi:hypothetical protein